MLRRLVWCGIVMLFVSHCAGQGKATVYHRDVRTGLDIGVLPGWSIDSSSPVFSIVTFPPNERPRMSIVPMNEAEISVIAAPKNIVTVAAWMAEDRIKAEDGVRIDTEEVNLPSLGIVQVTVIREEVKVILDARSTSYVFQSPAGLVKIHLFYRGQKHRQTFEAAAWKVLHNLRLAR